MELLTFLQISFNLKLVIMNLPSVERIRRDRREIIEFFIGIQLAWAIDAIDESYV